MFYWILAVVIVAVDQLVKALVRAYIPLHTAPAGQKFGRFDGEDVYTTRESERLTRLPLFYGLTDEARAEVIEAVKEFFK